MQGFDMKFDAKTSLEKTKWPTTLMGELHKDPEAAVGV